MNQRDRREWDPDYSDLNWQDPPFREPVQEVFEPFPLPTELEMKKPQTLAELVLSLKSRFLRSRTVEITEEEFLVIANAADNARKALSHMTQSETPFYSGMAALKEI